MVTRDLLQLDLLVTCVVIQRVAHVDIRELTGWLCGCTSGDCHVINVLFAAAIGDRYACGRSKHFSLV